MIEIIDGLRELLEPTDPVDETRSTNGLILDRTCSQPFDQAPSTVYAWEESCSHVSIGTGEVQERFEVIFVLTLDNEGETSIAQRSRDVSIALDAKRKEWMRLIRLHKNLFDGDLAASSDADFLRQLDLRGIAVRIAGWRLITGDDEV